MTVYTKEDVTNAIMMHVKENQLMKGETNMITLDSTLCDLFFTSPYPTTGKRFLKIQKTQNQSVEY